MNDEKLLKKIKKNLIRYGVEEEEADSFLEDLKNLKDDDAETPAPVEEETKETTEVESDSEAEPKLDNEVEKGEDEKVESDNDGEPVEEENKVEVKEDDKGEEEEVEEKEENKAEDMPIPEAKANPEVPPAESVQQVDQTAEMQKAFDSLVQRINALEDSLTKAGVLVAPRSPVGIANSGETENGKDTTQLNAILAELNGK